MKFPAGVKLDVDNRESIGDNKIQQGREKLFPHKGAVNCG